MRALLVGLCLSSLITLAAPPRDPFAKSELAPPIPAAPCNTSLCRHELGDLKLVAIVSPGPQSMAMFENAQGKGFVARRNAQIGNGGARVTRIDGDCVTITRFVSGENGRQQPVAERVCVESSVLIADHDYLTDGPYKAP
jgi:Tfp pilus assembly protein PilP